MGAILFFTPTLTRTAPATGWVTWLPFVGVGIGICASIGIQHHRKIAIIAAILSIALNLALEYWLWQRQRNTLGDPHPGLRWYQVAVGFLILGLSTIVVDLGWPEYGWPLRPFHQHINLLGFIGITAMGTLHVFLPTIGSYQSPKAGLWLKQHLTYCALATVCVAVGAASVPWFSLIGRVLWLMPLGLLILSIWQARKNLAVAPGSAHSLVWACVGFVFVISMGPPIAPPIFFTMYLFPLVTGALSHFFPLWWWPTQHTAQRAKAQHFLGQGGAARGMLFFLAGLATVWGFKAGLVLAWLVLMTFIVQVGIAKLKFGRELGRKLD